MCIFFFAGDAITDSDGGDSSTDDEGDIRSVDSGIGDGDFDYLVGHPEDFLNTKAMEILKKASWNSRVRHIFVDEAHCVVHWGENFRTSYRCIDTLKSLFPSSKPQVVAVTATATVVMQRDIIRLLDMSDPNVVVGHTDRTNVTLKVIRRDSHAGKDGGVEASYTAVFMPLLKQLKHQRERFPQTVVYTALKWCGFGNELGVKVLADGAISSVGVKEVSQYHAHMIQEVGTYAFK